MLFLVIALVVAASAVLAFLLIDDRLRLTGARNRRQWRKQSRDRDRREGRR